MKPKPKILYGRNIDGVPKLFPRSPIAGAMPYVMVKDGKQWYALHEDGTSSKPFSEVMSYNNFARKGDWIPFVGDPFLSL